MDCNETRRLLDAYVDGELELTPQLDMEAHLAACFTCKEAAEAAIDFRYSVRMNMSVYKATPELKATIRAALRKNPDPGSNGEFQAMYRSEAMKVLLAEDEKKVSHFIRKALREAGYEVETVYDGNQAVDQAGNQTFDVIILDIMMPGKDGLAVLRRLREERNATPVMLLTARGAVSERVEGLELGADDYLAKPFAMRELVARVNALSRRSSGDRATTLRVADLSMNLLSREVTRGGQKIDLAVREFALLEFLMRYPGRVLSRTSICEQVWDYHFDTGTNLVDVYINRLRRKIDDFHEIKLLQTVRGVGYILRPLWLE